MIRKLTRQEWAMYRNEADDEYLLVSFQNYQIGCTLTLKKGKKEWHFTAEETRALKQILEDTNYIFNKKNK